MSKFEKLAWNEVNWHKLKSRVFRIQRRIYKAKSERKISVVHYLQNKLLNSLDAKLLSVEQVASKYKPARNKVDDNNILDTPEKKINLAYCLNLTEINNYVFQKSTVFLREENQKTLEKKAYLIKDKAKQKLIKLALEPEWESVFEDGSHGYRLGRNQQDIIENISSELKSTSDYIFYANLSSCFEYLNPEEFIKKLNTIKIIEIQIRMWLKSNIMLDYSNKAKEMYGVSHLETFQEHIIAPLICNIIFHGLITHLGEFCTAPVDSPILKTETKKKVKGFRYLEKLILISTSIEKLERAKMLLFTWVNNIGTKLNEKHVSITKIGEGFNLLGFNIIVIKKKERFYTKVHISKESKKYLLSNTRLIIQKNKAASAYILIQQLTPIIFYWASYFIYSECQHDFRQVDNRIFGQLRAWVFRRKANGKNRTFLKEKYFPNGKTFIYEGVKHKDNWVLCGQNKEDNNRLKENYLPKLSWLHPKKYIQIKANYSIYNGDHLYWTKRIDNYIHYELKLKQIIKVQKNICILCNKIFSSNDRLEIYNGSCDIKKFPTLNLNSVVHQECYLKNISKENNVFDGKSFI